MQCPGVTSSRRGSTSSEESQIIALALPPQYNNQGRCALNGFTGRSHAVNDGGYSIRFGGKSLCRLCKREELREGPLLTAATEGTRELLWQPSPTEHGAYHDLMPWRLAPRTAHHIV